MCVWECRLGIIACAVLAIWRWFGPSNKEALGLAPSCIQWSAIVCVRPRQLSNLDGEVSGAMSFDEVRCS